MHLKCSTGGGRLWFIGLRWALVCFLTTLRPAQSSQTWRPLVWFLVNLSASPPNNSTVQTSFWWVKTCEADTAAEKVIYMYMYDSFQHLIGNVNQGPSFTVCLLDKKRQTGVCWGKERSWQLGSFGTATMKFAQFLMKNSSVAGIPKQVERFSKFSPSPLSMKQFIDFGKCFQDS